MNRQLRKDLKWLIWALVFLALGPLLFMLGMGIGHVIKSLLP